MHTSIKIKNACQILIYPICGPGSWPRIPMSLEIDLEIIKLTSSGRIVIVSKQNQIVLKCLQNKEKCSLSDFDLKFGFFGILIVSFHTLL